MTVKLLKAALTGDWVGVKHIIETEDELSDINESMHNDGLTPLALASIAGEWELVYTMVTKFKNINVNAHQSIAPYIQGFRCPEEDHFVAEHINKMRANSKYQHLEKTPLWYAIKDKQWFIVEALQQKGADLIYRDQLPQNWQADCDGYIKTLREFKRWPAEFDMGPMDDDASISRQIYENTKRYVFLPPYESSLVEPRIKQVTTPRPITSSSYEEVRLTLAELKTNRDKLMRETGRMPPQKPKSIFDDMTPAQIEKARNRIEWLLSLTPNTGTQEEKKEVERPQSPRM